MTTEVVDWTVKDAIVGLVSRGVPIVQAARQVGLSGKRELNRLLEDDAAFREALDDAMEVMIGRLDHRVYEEALDGNAKFAELAYRRLRPEMMQTGAAGQKAANAPQIHVAQMVVQVVRELVTGDHAPDFIESLHRPQAIAVTAVEVEDEDD